MVMITWTCFIYVQSGESHLWLTRLALQGLMISTQKQLLTALFSLLPSINHFFLTPSYLIHKLLIIISNLNQVIN